MDERLKAEASRLRARLKDAPLEADVKNAANFLRAGGAVDWDRWESMGPYTKQVLSAAGRVVADERALAVARALVQTIAPVVEPKAPAVDERQAMRAAGMLALEAGKTT